MTIRRAALVLVLSLWSAGLTAEEWPQFRGLSGGLGVDHRDLPDTWGPATNVAWVATVGSMSRTRPVPCRSRTIWRMKLKKARLR